MYQNITEIKQFVSSIFPNLGPYEHCIFWGSPQQKPGFPVSYDNFFNRTLRGSAGRACYFSTSTVRPDDDGRLYNRQKLFGKMYCIVLDDIGSGAGSKCEIADLPETLRDEYSWRLETSPNNFQYGFLLSEPIENLNAAIEFVKIIYGAGPWDSGGALPNKLVRMPCGVNLKKKYMTEGEQLWAITPDSEDDYDEPFLTFTPDELLVIVNAGVTFQNILDNTASKIDPRRTRGATAWREGAFRSNMEGVVDDVLEFLNERDLIVNENNEWIDIICPWHKDHTEGDNTAGYKPLGFGNNPERRGFHCFHGHCSSNRTHDFLKWITAEGGPESPIVDPIPALVSKWALDMVTNEFVNLQSARLRRIPHPGFKTGHQQDVFWVGNDEKPKKATQYGLIIKNPGLLKLMGSIYLPGGTPIIENGDEKQINEWHIPNWSTHKTGEHDANWSRFCSFLEYLMPEPGDADWFLDHIAAKVQNPTYRGPCVLLTTPVFGSGRGTLVKMLGQLWGGHNISSVGLTELLNGFSGEGFNDWLKSVWTITPEARESNMSRRQESRAYETLKTGIDPQPTNHIIKTKYGGQGPAIIYCSFLICSNHQDILNIPINDRRFMTIQCTVEAASVPYFKALNQWLSTDWESDVWFHLKNRDISHHEGFAPANLQRSQERHAEQKLFLLSGQSRVDRLVTLSTMFADEKCGGLVLTNIFCDWISEHSVSLGIAMIPQWEDVFKRVMQGSTAEIKLNGKRRSLKIEGKKTFARHTLSESGYHYRDFINETGNFEDIKRVIGEQSAATFKEYALEILNDAGL